MFYVSILLVIPWFYLVVKIGMIGCGSISWYHLKQIKALESAEIVAAYNRSSGPREKFGKFAGLPKCSLYSDIRKMLKHPKMDAVINCLPNSMHSWTSIEAMEADLDVLCEKPMATSYAQAKRMIEAANKNGKKLLIGLTKRFSGETIAAKKVVENGMLGKIYYSKAGWLRRNGIPGWGSQFTRKDMAGAGPIYDIGVHALDNVCWLMSDFNSHQVLASSYAKFGPYKKGIGDWGVHDFEGYFDVEDLASALIKMKSGATVSFEVSWAAHIPVSHYTVRLMGNSAGLDLEQMMIYSTENEEVNIPINYEKTDAYFEEMKHFIECIENNFEPITSPHQMLELQRMLDMIQISSQEQRLVKSNEIN
jgi:predicted dehydrogenase